MKDQLSLLYRLHICDKRAAVLRKELECGSESAEMKRKSDSAASAAKIAEAEISKLGTDAKDNELKLKTIEAKRADYEKKYYDGSVTSTRDLSAIEKEIENLKAQQAQIDSDLLHIYDSVTALKVRHEKAAKAAKVWSSRYQSAHKAETGAKKHITDEYNKLMDERGKLMKLFTNKALISRYESIHQKVGDTGAALVLDNHCEFCHVSITHYIARILDLGNDFETCENCGRILLKPQTEEVEPEKVAK